MPLYYFFFRGEDGLVADEEGCERPDLAAALATALDSARRMMAEEIASGHLDLGQQIEIRDATGHVLACFDFANAVEIRLPIHPAEPPPGPPSPDAPDRASSLGKRVGP